MPLLFSIYLGGGRAGRISVIPYFAFLFFFSVINLGKDAPFRNRNAETAEPSCLFTYAHSIDFIGEGLCLFLLRDKKASWQFYLFVFLFLFCYENSYFISKSTPSPATRGYGDFGSIPTTRIYLPQPNQPFRRAPFSLLLIDSRGGGRREKERKKKKEEEKREEEA